MHSEPNTWTVFAQDVKVTDDTLTVDLTDGRTISAPILWYPRLAEGTPEERNKWELGSGVGIHWPDLDEDISVENLLRGQPSGESQKSLQRWLDARKGKILDSARTSSEAAERELRSINLD
jgi:hypothetical protein